MSFKAGFFFVAALFTLQSSFAAEVKITSFLYTGTRSTTAELCGKVSGKSELPLIVDITVDPKRNNPGSYTVIPAVSGKFCTVVSTESGNADVSLRGGTGKLRATIGQ